MKALVVSLALAGWLMAFAGCDQPEPLPDIILKPTQAPPEGCLPARKDPPRGCVEYPHVDNNGQDRITIPECCPE